MIPGAGGGEMAEARAKPTVAGLGIDVGAQAWRRSGDGDGAVELSLIHI